MFALVFALAARAVFVFASVFAFAGMVESSAERTVRLAAEHKAAKRQHETAQAAQTGAGALLLAPEPVTRPSENRNWRKATLSSTAWFGLGVSFPKIRLGVALRRLVLSGSTEELPHDGAEAPPATAPPAPTLARPCSGGRHGGRGWHPGYDTRWRWGRAGG